MFEVMSKQHINSEIIEVPDIFAERAPFWYARLKTTRKLESLNTNRTIHVDNRKHNTNLTIHQSSIAGEIHGFTSRYRFQDPNASFETLCSTCNDYGYHLRYAAEYNDKDEFECTLKDFALHIIKTHPQKIPLQGA